MGVWLPLALADIRAAILAPWVDAEKREALLNRADTLAAWCLPMMAASVRAAEDEQRALELLRSVERLKQRQEARGASPVQ